MKSAIAILLFAFVAAFIVSNEGELNHNQFSSDKCGYYIYLPAIFIYHSLDKLTFYDGLDTSYSPGLDIKASLHTINGNRLNKYPAGVAILQAPLFFATHMYCTATRQYKADGFSAPYQLAGIITNILCAIAGLFLLRRYLAQSYTDGTVAIVMLCIAFGTNLYCYTAFEQGMSHPCSFLLFAGLLLVASNTGRSPGLRNSITLGLLMGLIFITRPINIIAVLIPLLYGCSGIASFKLRLQALARHYGLVLAGLVAFLLVASVQFSYWKYITGHWLFYAYKGEGFNFLHPSIINGLFSYKKGWLVYTPMALVAIAGMYYLWQQGKKQATAISVFLVVMVYAVFSWREWWYGGGFGCRPLIEALPVLAIPLAAIVAHYATKAPKAQRLLFFACIALLITLNIFQTYQYSMGLLHWNGMSREGYWAIFGRVSRP